MKKYLLYIMFFIFSLSGIQYSTQAQSLISQGNDKDAVLQVKDAYPNPARSEFTVEYELLTDKTAELAIFNLLGAKVATHELKEGNRIVTLKVSDLSEGVYFYSVLVEGKTKYTKRLVIKR